MEIVKKYYPFLFILLIWFVFSYPFFLKGKVPFPSTYQVNSFAPWSSYEKYWGPVKNNAMPDIITQIYPWKYFTIDQWRHGQIPLWNPYSFSGTPHLANYQSAVLSPFNLLFFLFSFVDAWSLLVLLQPLLAGLFIYIFIRTLRVSKISGLISSVSFMFSGFITTWMDYGTMGYAILFLPLSLFSIEMFYQTHKIRYLFLLSFSIPLSFFAGHLQTSLYFFLFISAYVIYKFIVKRDKKALLLTVLYLFFGLLFSMPQILPSIEFYKLSVRSSIFQKMETIPWSYMPTLLAPDFYGNPVTRNDWFGHYAEWNAYTGLIPLLLGLYSFLKIKSKNNNNIIFFGVVMILSLLFAFNTPLIDLLIGLQIPVLSTSAASRIIVIFSFSIAVLSGLGLDQLIKDIKIGNIGKILIWLIFSSTLFLSLWAIVVFKLLMPIEKIDISRSNLILPSLLFVASIGIILISIVKKKIILFTMYFLLFTTSFDMIRFAVKWQPFDRKDLVFANTSVSNFYSNISSYSRVLGNFEAGNGVYYKLPSVDGYDPLYIERYGEFVNAVSNGKIASGSRSVVAFPRRGLYTLRAIGILGIRYVIHKTSDGRFSWTFPFWQYPSDQFLQIYKDDKFEIYKNTKTLPRAFLASDYRVISDPQKIINTLFDEKFDYWNNILVEEDPGFPSGKQESKQADIISYTPNEINIQAVLSSKSLLLLTDIFYPGWKAYVDNKETPILRANYTFRSVVVPKGSHDVKFVYDPESFKIGVYLALIGFLGIVSLGFIIKLNLKVKTFPPRQAKRGRQNSIVQVKMQN